MVVKIQEGGIHNHVRQEVLLEDTVDESKRYYRFGSFDHSEKAAADHLTSLLKNYPKEKEQVFISKYELENPTKYGDPIFSGVYGISSHTSIKKGAYGIWDSRLNKPKKGEWLGKVETLIKNRSLSWDYSTKHSIVSLMGINIHGMATQSTGNAGTQDLMIGILWAPERTTSIRSPHSVHSSIDEEIYSKFVNHYADNHEGREFNKVNTEYFEDPNNFDYIAEA